MTKPKEQGRPPASYAVLERRERPSPSSQLWRASLILTAVLVTGWGLWTTRQPVMELLSLLGDQAAVSAYLQSFGIWGPLVLAFAQLIQIVAAVIPGHVLLVAAGYVYGLPLGFLLNIVYIVAASQLTYSLARWAGRPLVSRFVAGDKLDRWYSIGEKQGFTFFTIAFLLPVFPTDVMNFVAGLSGIPPRKFLAANFLGRLPGALILTLIGSHGLQFSNAVWATIAILIVTVYVAGRIVIGRIERQHN
ncbi:MAG: TVP38/TMEM64 family protein [Chloroflexi bacterium]|nr:TVP38/TMEM64 family protein [Chloroflexota bacterium]